jgi:hypothetical protein
VPWCPGLHFFLPRYPACEDCLRLVFSGFLGCRLAALGVSVASLASNGLCLFDVVCMTVVTPRRCLIVVLGAGLDSCETVWLLCDSGGPRACAVSPNPPLLAAPQRVPAAIKLTGQAAAGCAGLILCSLVVACSSRGGCSGAAASLQHTRPVKAGCAPVPCMHMCGLRG